MLGKTKADEWRSGSVVKGKWGLESLAKYACVTYFGGGGKLSHCSGMLSPLGAEN